jgi:hypothetical protein
VSKIDQHNRSRQADLGIERKLGTQKWWKRINHAILSMITVDAYYVHKHCTGSIEPPNEFYHKLASEMINYEALARERAKPLDDIGAAATAGEYPRLTPTKRV